MQPIRVKLLELSDKRKLLSRAKKLKDIMGMEKVYILRDLTQKQLMKDRVLREEVRKMKEAGAMNVRIFKGIIVSGEQN